ncbi:hypothetical protein QUF58_14585 [Anaerolineales bacterium HSG24]|nr:hypothetical protein [Anaerolineales bacterium HSG24]
MSESRPPFKSAQQFLGFGLLVGILVGCIVGSGIVYTFINTTDFVYVGGAYPNELTINYQDHYLAMTIDSYLANQQLDQVEQRFQSFPPVAQIRALARQSAAYAASGRTAEAQMINDLGIKLKTNGGWTNEPIKSVLADLSTQYQAEGNAIKSQALNDFSLAVLGSVIVPVDAEQPPADAEQPPADAEQPPVDAEQPPVDAEQPPADAEQPPAQPGVISANWWYIVCACLLGLLGILFALWIIRRRTAADMARKKEIVYEGEGVPPILQWSSTYTLGRNPYDESFTLETEDGDFLGEAGIGMNNVVEGSDSGQVKDFDVWVFDKTDINTYSRIVMSEVAYNDEELRNRVELNPLAKAVWAKQGDTTTIESKTMRIEVKMEEVEFDESKLFFNNLKVTINVFLQEGVDIKSGVMDIPDHMA